MCSLFLDKQSNSNNMTSSVRKSLELFSWVFAIACLSFLDPTQTEQSLCFFNWLGFEHCPGCGLGKSISYALDGQLNLSFATHMMGTPVLAGLILRIIQLIHKNFITTNLNYENKSNYC
jgi:hypothetical protein